MEESKILSKYFPIKGKKSPKLQDVLNCFKKVEDEISSDKVKKQIEQLGSNDVLKIVGKELRTKNYEVEGNGTKIKYEIHNKKNDLLKRFFVDARSTNKDIIIEVESGQTIYANKCYYDIFKACMIKDVDYVVIAVRKIYRYTEKPDSDNQKTKKISNYERVSKDIEAIFASGFGKRLPLEGILLIGY